MQQQLVRCPHCGNDSAGPQFCTTCGERLPAAIPQPVPETQPGAPVKPAVKETATSGRYGALRAVATVYRIIGWVLMIGGSLFSIALAVLALSGTGALADFIPLSAGMGTVGIAIAGLIVSILSGLFLVAFADVCYVLIDIEKNTRSKA
jgi:hypothetical protein